MLLFTKWKFNVTWWCKCGFELLWVLQNSTAWKNKHKAPCWGNGISCTEGRSEPMLVWSDLFFFFWLDDYNRYVHHAIYLSPSASWGVDINAISSWTEDFYGYLIHICGRHFSCTQPFLPRRSSWGNVRAWLADECKDSGGKVGCFASSSVQRIGLVAIQYFMY